MKVTISDKDKSLLIILAALVVLSISYFGIYQGTMKKVEALREENAVLEEKIVLLQEKVARREEVLTDTEEKNEMSAKLVGRFPAEQTTQNIIFTLEQLEQTGNFDILSESFSMNADFWQSEGLEPELKGYCSKVTITYETSYSGLKKALDFIAAHKDRMTVTDISSAYSTATGELTGTMTIALYSVEGTERVYVDPVLGYINYGVKNILRTGE